MTFHNKELALDSNPRTRLNESPDKTQHQKIKVEEPLLSRYWQSLPLCIISGIFLGIHFSMWVFSLRHTSLTHSLLWVSMGPIVLNGGTWFLYLLGQSQCMVTIALCAAISLILVSVRRPSAMETTGVLLGISGAIVMLVGVKRVGSVNSTRTDDDNEIHEMHAPPNHPNHPPTVYGDAAAFSGAVAVCVYLIIGQKLRTFLPIWLYVFPVIGAATITCLIFSLLDDNDPCTIYGFTRTSIFGFLSRDFFLYALYLGVGPGIFGHTLLNALLKYVSPLVVSTAMLMEPIIGSVIGYYCGLQPLPDVYTWIGGGVLMVGLVLVVMGENEQADDIEVDFQKNQSRNSCSGDIDKGSYGSIQESEPSYPDPNE